MMNQDAFPSSKFYRVAVLSGGDSDEAVISRKSGASVFRALLSRGHEVVALDPAVVDLAGIDWSQFDVAFLALHGHFGEDGQVQQLLADRRVPFTGSDAAASRLAFHKSAAKECFLLNGVPTPDYLVIHANDDRLRIHTAAAGLGYPLVVKPEAQGSSLGVSIVQSPSELEAALRLCFQYDSFGMMERAIWGTEWTVGMLDRQILPALQIETPRAFFDYEAKYLDQQTSYRFQHQVGKDVIARIESVAQQACEAVGTAGLARVDLRLDSDLQPWVLEINTIPGLTDQSLVPKAAAQSGMEFGLLCEEAIRCCLKTTLPGPHWQKTSRRQPLAASVWADGR